MKFNEISRFRLHAQKLIDSEIKDPGELVSYMGAMQSQDYAMSKTALAMRLNDGLKTNSLNKVEEAIAKGEIIRTHVLRPTWHLVNAEDTIWMLELSGEQIKRAAKPRHKELGITDDILKKSEKILLKELSKGKHLNREALHQIYSKAKIETNENRLSHLLMWAEVSGIICSGKPDGNEITYALIEERIKKPLRINKEEAVSLLADKYFQSHGPATIQDFSWWSGLNLTVIKKTLAENENKFIKEKIEGVEYYFSDKYSNDVRSNDVFLIPAYDEFIISYADRSATLAEHHIPHAISVNGIFKPVILYKGKAIGIWSRLIKKEKVAIQLIFFESIPDTLLKKIKVRCDAYAALIGKEVSVEVK